MAEYNVPVLSLFSWQLPVEDKDLSDAPGGESKGDRYIIAAGISSGDDWYGHENDIAMAKQDSPSDPSHWIFATPVEGWVAWVNDENRYYYFDGSSWELVAGSASLSFVIDGGGEVITTGVKGDLEVPFDCEITSATLLADVSGSVKIDIWKDTYTNFPPLDGDTITGGNEPEISGATKDQDGTLTNWTKSLSAGDILRFYVDSCATITRVTLALRVDRT